MEEIEWFMYEEKYMDLVHGKLYWIHPVNVCATIG